MTDCALAELMSALPELEGLKPAENQPGLPTLLQKVGENVKSFSDTFPDTTAREQITLEILDWKGKAAVQQKEQFNYLDLAQPRSNDVALKECRTDAKGRPLEPTPIGEGFVSKGYVSMVVYFHLALQPNTTYRDLGSQIMDGRQTEVIEPDPRDQHPTNGQRADLVLTRLDRLFREMPNALGAEKS